MGYSTVRRIMREGLTDPRNLDGIALWNSTRDVTDLTTGTGIKLWADKSGNSSTNVLCLNGVAGNYASAPDSAALDITGDIDVRAHVSLADWTPAASQALVSKYGAAGQRSFTFFVNATTGTLQFAWTADGSILINKGSTVAPSVSDFGALWVRATLDVDNGAGGNDVVFYTSPDGVTWTQLGATVTTATATSIFNSTAQLEIGANGGAGAGSPTNGNIYRAQIYAGLTGSDLRFDANFSLPAKLAPSFVCATGQTVTINASGATGARISGARDLYQGTVASQPIYLPWSGSNYGYLNGVSGNTITTPDNAAFAGATACDVRVWVVPSDVALGGKELFSQYFSADNKRVFTLATDPITSTKISFFCSQLGTPVAGVASSVAATMSNGVGIGLRATWRASDGRVQFFTRSDFAGMPDSTGWTQLGTDKTIAGVASLYDSDQPFYIGGKQDQATNYPGRYLYADARVAIDGARIVCFDPAGYSSGQSFAGPTGETWTIASGATIVTRTCLYFDGSNNYLKAAAFALSQPETVYFVGSQVTHAGNDTLYDGNAADTMRLLQAVSPYCTVFAGTTGVSGSGLGYALATQQIYSAIYNGASSVNRVNRNTAGTGQAGAGNANGFLLGAYNNGASGWANITAQEVLVYSTAQDENYQYRVTRLLSRRTGVLVV